MLASKRGWWSCATARARTKLAFGGALGLGALVGMASALAAFHPSFILGTSAFWGNPRGDVKFQLTGYLHYVHESWGWPLGVSHTIHPPTGYNVAFADTTPLLALTAKIVEPIVPGALQRPFEHPFGLWLLAVYILQGVMMARAVWWLGVRSLVGVVCSAALACSLPVFVIRSGQTSLTAQFFLLWAILLIVIVRTEPPNLRRGREWLVLMGAVALVHPYLLAMTGTMLIAWLGTALVSHRARGLPLTIAALALATSLASLATFGLLSEQLHWAPFFGEASFNPAMLVMTRFGALNPLDRWIDPVRADATGFQYEGYDYLGLGFIGLVVIALSRRSDFIQIARRHIVLGATLLSLVVFAFSNRVYVGQKLLVAWEVPHHVRTLVSQFRSSGRFVWPATYGLLLVAIVATSRIGRHGKWILLGATLIQIIDVAPHFQWVRDVTKGPDEHAIDDALWSPILGDHRAVWSYPSFECGWTLRGAWDDANYKTLYELSYRSAALGKVVNSIHNARPGLDCLDDVRERESVTPRPDTLYVFMRRAATGKALAGLEQRGARCTPFDRGFACSMRFDDTTDGVFSRSAATARYAVGSWIVFGGDGAGSEAFEGGAWGPRTEEGAYVGWPIEGFRSTVHFGLDGLAVGSRLLELDVDGESGALAATEVEVEANATRLGVIRLAAGERRTVFYRIPRSLVGHDRWLAIDLSEPDAASSQADRHRARLRVRRVRLHAVASEASAAIIEGAR